MSGINNRVNFNITNTIEGYYNWGGYIFGTDFAIITSAQGIPRSVHSNSGFEFNLINTFSNLPLNNHGGGVNGSYFTIRDNIGYNFGYSIDIWSESLTNFIAEGKSWHEFTPGTQFVLSSEKYSLMYDYASTFAPVWSKGGTITLLYQQF